MKKTLLSTILALLPLIAYAYDFASDGFYYNINPDDASVSVTYKNEDFNSYSGSVVIPSTTQYNNKLYSVTSIDWHAFGECSGLTSVTIPNSVTNIGEYAFYKCSGLTSVTIPNSVTSIGFYAFYDCTGLTSIIFGNNVERIGGSAFDNTAWLDNQPDGVVYAGKVAYKYKGTMSENTHITIKDGTLGIAESAFVWCSNLISVTLPDGLTNIGSGAFLKTRLQSFNIPESVTRIGDGALGWVDEIPWLYNHPTGLVYVGKFLYKYKGTMPEDTHITIKDGTVRIADCALAGYKNITSVTIPESVISIGEQAFYYCTGLTSITVPKSVKSIGESAFGYCTGLTSIDITEGVTSIGNLAFELYSGLTSITIPNSVTSIGNNAFSPCRSLTSVTIPESVTSIGRNVFFDCSGLTSVTLPNSLTRIPSGIFGRCSSLTSITIPNSVTSIGSWVFRECSGLTSVTIGNSVTSIEEHAFEECRGLNSLTCLAKNVPNTGYQIFRYVPTSSATLYVPESSIDAYKSTYPWSSFGTILPIAYDFEENGLAYNINPDETSVMLMNCASVNSAAGDVVIPSKVQYNGVWYDVTGIEDNAFYDCDELASVTIPNSITSIGKKAFYGCSSLKNVVCQARNLPTTGYGCFSLIPLNSATLYVPSAAVNDYKAAEAWNSFGIIKSIPDNFQIWEIKFDKTEIILSVHGDPYQLTASVAPAYAANKTLTWTSSNTNVATVDANGLVTPVSQGIAVITATTQDGSNLSATCVVTVEVNNDISDVSQLSNNKCYYIYTKDQLRGGLGVNTEYGNLASTFLEINAQYKTESISPFIFLNYNDKFYLYSVEANAFVTNTGGLSRMGVSDANAINITKNTNEYFMISFASTGKILNINSSGLAINNWGTSASQYDEGNQFTIEVAGNFDPTAIINMIKEYEDIENENAEHYAQTPVQGLSELVNTQVYTALTKRAAWYVPAFSKQLESNKVPLSVDLNCRNSGQQFAFILHNGQYYLYSVGEKKILNGITNNSPNRGVLVTEDCQPVTITATHDTQYPLFFSYGTSYNVNIDGSGRVTIDTWTTMDEGNKVALRPVHGVTLTNKEMRSIIGYIDGYILGDANDSGGVEIGDITSVLTLMANPDATGYNNKAADANQSGGIEIGDITTILTIMAGE